jgi:hypothetical protein
VGASSLAHGIKTAKFAISVMTLESQERNNRLIDAESQVSRIFADLRCHLTRGLYCSGLMKPDTHLGENARQIEVSDDQTTSFLFR